MFLIKFWIKVNRFVQIGYDFEFRDHVLKTQCVLSGMISLETFDFFGPVRLSDSESVDFDPKFDQKHEFEIYFR